MITDRRIGSKTCQERVVHQLDEVTIVGMVERWPQCSPTGITIPPLSPSANQNKKAEQAEARLKTQ